MWRTLELSFPSRVGKLAFNVTLLEETLASTLSALDSSQAAQLALQQRVAELESQHSRLGNGADATTQTEFDVEGLEESLLLSALYPRLEVCRRQQSETQMAKVVPARLRTELTSFTREEQNLRVSGGKPYHKPLQTAEVRLHKPKFVIGFLRVWNSRRQYPRGREHMVPVASGWVAMHADYWQT